MLDWLVNNSYWFYGLLILAAVAVVYVWWVNRRREYLIALGVVGALLAGLWLLSLLVVTDEQKIRNALYEMADGVANGKPDKVVKHLARDFQYAGVNRTVTKADVHDAIARSVKAYDISDFSLRDVQFQSLSGGLAKVEFKLYVGAMGNEVSLPTFCRSEFVLEDGQWRLKTIKFYKGFVGSDQELRFPVP